ncbi:MAG: serine protease [Bdellovibrionota bacterium]
MKAMLFLLLSLPAMAVIHGIDDRHETNDPGISALLSELALSSPMIVEKIRLVPKGDHFEAQGTLLSKIGFCPDARYAEQKSVARCSSSLVGEDLILTAGHCVDEDLKKWCSEYSVVFDFKTGNTKEIPKENVYHCKEVIYRVFDEPFGEDLSLIRLSRKVTNRTPIKISNSLNVGEKLSMIGYPLGIPQKIVDDGEVTMTGPLKYSFRHTVDSFSCNSGGPLFNTRGEQVGVLVRGTGQDFSNPENRKCYDWTLGKNSDYTEANSLLHLKLPR